MEPSVVHIQSTCDHRYPQSTIVTLFFQVLLSIGSLLTDANASSPLNGEAGAMYQNNRALFNQTAQEWVQKHAKQ